MNNIKHHNFNNLKISISNKNHWDVYLALNNDAGCYVGSNSNCGSVWYDFNNINTYKIEDDEIDVNNIISLNYWDKAYSDDLELHTFGLTGLDNGFIPYNVEWENLETNSLYNTNNYLMCDIVGEDPKEHPLLTCLLLNSTLEIEKDTTRLPLKKVGGSIPCLSTPSDLYPNIGLSYTINEMSEVFKNETIRFVEMLGGFYQGFFALDGYNYGLLPTRVNNSWSVETIVKPYDDSIIPNTLNAKYPNNHGFIFYLGTRAENKFWKEWGGNDYIDCNIGDTCSGDKPVLCTPFKESDISIIGDGGNQIPLTKYYVDTEKITNNFLIYGRARDKSEVLEGEIGTLIEKPSDEMNFYNQMGTKRVCNYCDDGIFVKRFQKIKRTNVNPFLFYGRGKGKTFNPPCDDKNTEPQETVCSFGSIDGYRDVLDYKKDLVNNAFGVRITDDGKIGYRMIVKDDDPENCIVGETSIKIIEDYSDENVISKDEWSYIVIKFLTNYVEDCDLPYEKPRTGKLYIYVNGRLRKIFNDVPEVTPKPLNDYKDKQIGVPYNISVGGGSQGLLEHQTLDGQDPNDLGLPIETNFAGSFIGGMREFKFNICEIKYDEIVRNAKNYGLFK